VRDDRFRYFVEIYKRDSGALLGRSPIQVDWGPVQEQLTFDLLRRGIIDDFSRELAVRMEPEWRNPETEFAIRGVRATAMLGENHHESIFVPIDYFRAEARKAADQFLDTGQLQSGELFEYRVLALQRDQAAAIPRPRIAIERVAASVPITGASRADFLDRALLFGAAEATDVQAFVHWRVLEEASILTRRAEALETGGILIGHLHRDPFFPEVFLEITAQVPANARSQLTRLSFTPDTWSQAQAAVEARGRNEIWLGWWHSHAFFKEKMAAENEIASHPSTAPFLSSDDLRLHRSVFPRAYSLALLITDAPDSGMSWTMFGWQNATVSQRGFHLIHAPLSHEFTALRGEYHAEIG
jgi:proteasome lid subunit RPN8/RPN11